MLIWTYFCFMSNLKSWLLSPYIPCLFRIKLDIKHSRVLVPHVVVNILLYTVNVEKNMKLSMANINLNIFRDGLLTFRISPLCCLLCYKKRTIVKENILHNTDTFEITSIGTSLGKHHIAYKMTPSADVDCTPVP